MTKYKNIAKAMFCRICADFMLLTLLLSLIVLKAEKKKNY